MYQVTFSYSDGSAVEEWLAWLQKRVSANGRPQACVLFHVLNASSDKLLHDAAIRAIERMFPDAAYLGCSSNANVEDGEVVSTGKVTIICDVFEDRDTSVEVMQLPLDFASQDATAQALLDRLAGRPDVVAVEIMNTVMTANMPRFCKCLSAVDERIAMFGGGAVNHDADFNDVVVYSSAGAATRSGVVFVLYSGSNLHIQTDVVQGWKPLGMPFDVTRVERMNLYELNGRPALDIYNHYLQFSEQDDFLQNGLCFPFCVEYEGQQVMRTPIGKGPDGSIVMPTDMSDISRGCRIAYGDPLAVRDGVKAYMSQVKAFEPQAVLAFTCVGRLMYWGQEYAAIETRPIQSLVPIAGFYTGGELLRQGGSLISHNLALVLVGLREGEPDGVLDYAQATGPAPMALNLQLSLLGHMASFIGAAANELQEANERLDAIARTDGLTGLANRREIERMVIEAVQGASVAGGAQPKGDATGSAVAGDEADENTLPSVVMFDIDGFKGVNDTYGHAAGDEVLRRMADLVRLEVESFHCKANAGRWGGEEFMVLVQEGTLEDALQLAEDLRASFAAYDFGEVGHCTMSVGVAQMREGDTSDTICSRADNALYRAKELGKNRVFTE